jgi:hypothetical protein
MTTQIIKDKYLGRGIHNVKFADSLMNGKLKQMLQVINNDLDLDVQIRNNYLNIYYKGGNIARVNGENSVAFDKFYFYLDMKETSKKDVAKDKKSCDKLKSQRDLLIEKFKLENYEAYFTEAKVIMDKWLEINPKPERMEQHKLSIANRYNKSDYTIIDLEYQVSTLSDFKCLFLKGKDKYKIPRFDIIAINKQGKLCVIEFKKGTGALYGNSGLKEHWDCYQESIGRNHEPFMDEMRRLLNQKQTFKIINEKVKITNPIPEFMFAYSYDNKKSIEEQDKAFNIEYNYIGEIIKVLKLQNNIFELKN